MNDAFDVSTSSRTRWQIGKSGKGVFLPAVREGDAVFADQLADAERQAEPILTTNLNPTQAQLSAILHSSVIAMTSKQGYAIVEATQGNGLDAWRQLAQMYDPQTDARLAHLFIELVGYKIGKGQDVQSGLVLWEAKCVHSPWATRKS